MHSQRDEEAVIVEWFKGRVGRFLDVGAYDRRKFSNTAALGDNGWSGVLVEASPFRAAELIKQFPEDRFVVAAVAAIPPDRGRWVELQATEDAVSTTNAEHRAKWATQGVPFWPVKVPAVTLAELFEAFGPFDFVNIDVEGENLDLALSFPLSRPDADGVELVCVEHDFQDEKIAAYFSGWEFKVVHKTAENLIMGRS